MFVIESYVYASDIKWAGRDISQAIAYANTVLQDDDIGITGFADGKPHVYYTRSRYGTWHRSFRIGGAWVSRGEWTP